LNKTQTPKFRTYVLVRVTRTIGHHDLQRGCTITSGFEIE